ncbi:pilus assembly protein MshP [Stutzerimonas xanthomarina]|uniref:Pilus assembly protein MshP n=2 Tax=Pseudomonadaceae TaxID=135621 RepID=A0A3R9AXN3_9GAMM|nr:pilus assembly protein MshP [Stutzerimonas xanthomarina]
MQKLRGHGLLLQKQHGFGLVAAMFLIIIIAGAIAAMWRISTTQTATSSLALQQARAYQAARTGLEWGIWHFLNGSCDSASFQVPEFDGFQVTVDCPSDQRMEYTDLHEEQPQSMVSQNIIATATYAVVGTPDYVYRQLSAVVEKPGEIVPVAPEEEE